ncbi:MAG: hypothetical protein GC191_19710 [Azospirillum sp.]|nr:hypothetical protein [Azospirillum sp.]
MSEPVRHQPDLDDEAAELAALTEAVAASLADPRPSIPHSKVRAWLLDVSAGRLDAEPPSP